MITSMLQNGHLKRNLQNLSDIAMLEGYLRFYVWFSRQKIGIKIIDKRIIIFLPL